MNKLVKYALLVGVAICTTASGEALGSGASGIAKAIAVGGWEVIDIATGPAHTIVAAEQELVRMETKEEKKIKEKIRPRLSVVYEKDKKKGDDAGKGDGGDSGEEGFDDAGADDDFDMDDDMGNEGEEGGKKKKRKIDAKLSKIKIKSKEVIDSVGSGIAGEGVDGIIKTQGKTSPADLVDYQQKKYISAAGTQDTKAAYEKQRQYDEQEQAVQMIAYAATVRQNVNDTIGTLVDKVNANYEDSDVKKDLDPENKKSKVEKTNDYNQVLRQYAYYSLVYDQLLSLEQQIIGLRLQTKGALAEQKASVLSDVLENK